MKLKVECSLYGNNGYNRHCQDFFLSLSKHLPVEINSYTFDKTQENKLKHLTAKKEDNEVIDLILHETNHPVFYKFNGVGKIAYNVWEATEQPEKFFNKLNEFEQVWVPSVWQRSMLIQQGMDKNKIKIIHEGIDPLRFNTTKLEENYLDETFPETKGKTKYIVVGRWCYRKSTREIIREWRNVFNKRDDACLFLLVDNLAYPDKKTSTLLKECNLQSENIYHAPFLSDEEYIKVLKSSDVFLSCSRSEGWNIPLLEAIACGLEIIATDNSGQTEFLRHGNFKNLIPSIGKTKARYIDNLDAPGYYYEPDFSKLNDVLRNLKIDKKTNYENSQKIIDVFNWDVVSFEAYQTLKEFYENFDINFLNGPKVEIKTKNGHKRYRVEIWNEETKKIEYTANNLGQNCWVCGSKKYYYPCSIIIKDSENRVVKTVNNDLKNKNVLITIESKALGDTLAWFPYVEEFRKKHECNLFVSTFWNNLFEKEKTYNQIRFLSPGASLSNFYSRYQIGCYDSNLAQNKNDWRETPIQKIASDILGLPYTEIKPKISVDFCDPIIRDKSYVCIAVSSTMKAKLWNNEDGWKQLINWLKNKNYEIVNVSKEKTNLEGVIQPNNPTIEQTISNIRGGDFFIGLPSGLSWLAWALNKEVFMITGFSQKFCEFSTAHRIGPTKGSCSGCFNDVSVPFDRGWNWCPRQKDFECTKSIPAKKVIRKINDVIK